MSHLDAENEDRVRARLNAVDDWDVFTTNDYFPVDFVMIKGGRLLAVAELKSRKINSTTYTTIYLSKAKRESIEQFAKRHNAAPYFLVEFTNDKKLKAIRLGEDRDLGEPVMRGRFDRGDKNDLEPMYLIEVSKMNSIP